MNRVKVFSTSLSANLLLGVSAIWLLSSCGIFRKSAKTDFVDGFYKQKSDTSSQMVYVDVVEEDIRIHPALKPGNGWRVDTLSLPVVYGPQWNGGQPPNPKFMSHSFDVDFLAIPLKFRPPQANVPFQLNTNLNGALYLGYRTDTYKVHYLPNPFGVSEREIVHFGFSFGGFSGLGNTFLSPTTTNEGIEQEYDGMVWSNGLAGIFAINKFTLGLAIGKDYLLDQNRSVWIYQNKWWFGLAFGLNLN